MNATITTLPGDGIGPDVVAQGVAVLNRVAAVFGHTFTINTALLGGCAIDATGTALPEATLIACQASDAVLLGAVGGPKWDNPLPKFVPNKVCSASAKHLVCMPIYARLRSTPA